MARAAFVYTDEFTTYHIGDAHPLQQKRLLMTHRLLDAYEAFVQDGVDCLMLYPATEADLLRAHAPNYLHALRTLSAGGQVADRARYGFAGLNNPPFAGMWEASLLYAGASLDCARLVTEGGYGAAFNPSGGLHHARASRAAGFCTVNDCALVAHWLLDRGARRLAYVDIDAHHGDGMQEIFYADPRVLTLSLHESPQSLYPRVTGFATEIGAGAGLGFNANLPLARGSGDAITHAAFDAAFLPLLHAYDPEFILLQVGADGHFSDRLAHLNWTAHGWLSLVQRVIALEKPTIALGGGGYNISTVARLWTLLFGALSGQSFPDAVPDAYAQAWGITHLEDPETPAVSPEEDARTREQAVQSVATVRRLVFPAHRL